MKRVLIIALVALLIPVLASAGPKMGIFFDYEKMSASPPAYTEINMYLYLYDAPYYVTAIEYQLQTPSDPTHALFSITEVILPPEASIDMGSPFEGHAISYYPPVNCFSEGFHLMCSYKGGIMDECWNNGGSLADYLLVIGPNPVTGSLQGTYAPDNEKFPITGLTSVLCPEEIGTEEESWGAIKSLFK